VVVKMDDQSRRKFLKQFAVLSVGVGSFILSGCEDRVDYGPIPPYGPPPIDSDPPDLIGNLYIRSLIPMELVLYDRHQRLKILLVGWTDSLYRVNVRRGGNEENELEMFRYFDVRENLDSPPNTDLFKRWSVILPTELSENPQCVWIMCPAPVEIGILGS